MEGRYQTLNKKLDTLINKPRTPRAPAKPPQTQPRTQPRIINLTNTKLTQEQTKVLSLGPQYAMEQKPSKYINELIIETENAIRRLEPNWRNMYRLQATARIKQIKENNKQNPLHKWQQNIIRKLKEELANKNITVAKADKSKAVVIIDKTLLHEKVTHFLQDNNTQQLKADPTDKYQKQILKAIQQCKLLINKKAHKYLTNM